MKDLVQVLLLEDNPTDAELMRATLEAAGVNCAITRVDTEPDFRKALEGDFDLIVSDYTLPSFDGKRALALSESAKAGCAVSLCVGNNRRGRSH